MSFYARFREAAARWPANVAVERQTSDGVESYTYAELLLMAECVGKWLTQQQVQAGARCALLAANSPRWVAAYLGTMATGGIAVPLDTAFRDDQVATLLRDSGAEVLFTDERHLPAARQGARGLAVKLVLLEGTDGDAARLDDILASGSAGFNATVAGSGDSAVILYTSGTTRDPAGVVLTHANLNAEADAAFSLLEVGPRDAILGILPLFHALAQMANLLLPLVVGARVVYLESLNTAELLRALRERRITIFVCVPQFFYLIHDRVMKEGARHGRLGQTLLRALMNLSLAARKLGLNPGKFLFRKVHQTLGTDIRYLITGGSRFDPGIGNDLYALGFDILQAYGLTETTGGAVVTPPDRNVIGSVGRPLKGVEVKIIDPKPPEDGEGPLAGEIALRGAIIMKGYYNRPDMTDAVLRQGWLHTGDLGYFDEDGNLFVTGRAKEVIVLSSGKNIYPEEIEAHYSRSPWIKEICVLGLESRPGEPFAERLHGVVVPDFEALRERRVVNTREVIRFDLESLSQRLAGAKRILSFDIWQDPLPRTTTRKLRRHQIKKRVQEQHAREGIEDAVAVNAVTAEESEWLEQEDVAKALAVIRQHLRTKKDQILPSDNLELDLGMDSMERVELLVALEAELVAKVEDSVASEVYSVREMVDVVRGAKGKVSERAQFRGWEGVFACETTDPQVLAIARRRPIAEFAWYLSSRLAQVVFRDLFQLKVAGLENLPKSGPCLICSNHQSYLDPAVLVSLLPWPLFRDQFSVGTTEIFGEGFPRVFARWANVIPIDPDANLVQGMQAGAFGLRRGKVMILYPEGERSIDGVPRGFKKGAAILSIHLGVPICPVAIEGFFDAWPRGKKFQGFRPLRMMFGEPIYPPGEAAHNEAAYARLTQELKTRIVAMWEELRTGNRTPAEPAAAD